MKRITRVPGVFLVAAMFLPSAGCAYFTAQRVATMAGKHVAKEVIKKGIKDSKEDKAKKEKARKDKAKKEQVNKGQAERERAKRQEAERAQLKKSQTQKPYSTTRPAKR